MYLRLTGLILAIFCVGTAELLPSGILGVLAGDLRISVASAGLLVTAYALTMAFLGPLVSASTTRVPRKALLLGLIAVFVVGNVVSALAPTFGVLLVGRVLTAVIHGTFMAVSVVTAGAMVPEGRSGSAVAAMQLGINLATVLGVPFGTLVGQALDWRAAFGLVGGLAAVAAVLVAVTIPGTLDAPVVGGLPEVRVFARWNVLGTVLGTVLCSGGMFTVITYFAPTLEDVSGYAASTVPVLLLAYGLASLVGNALGGKLADRALDRSVVVLALGLTGALVFYWLVIPTKVGAAVAIVVFSLATFALIPGLQTRVLTAAAAAPTLSLTANMSAFGVGAAAGSWIGGLVLDGGLGLRSLALVAAALTAAGFLVITHTVRTAARMRGAQRLHAPSTAD